MDNPLISYNETKEVATDISTKEFRDKFFSAFNQRLEEGDIRDINREETSISFTGSVCRYTWNGWNVFNPVTSGQVKIEEHKGSPQISYSFAFSEFFWMAVALTTLPGIAFYSGLIFWGVLEFLLIWGLFYVGSRAIASIRLNTLIAETTQKIINPPIEDFIEPEPIETGETNEYLNEDWNFFNQVFIQRGNHRPQG